MDELKLLRRLGMTEYEARAYLSLARLGPSTVREVVADSKLPRNKAYEALQRLEGANKVMSLPVSPRKYRICDPEVSREEVRNLDNAVSSLIQIVEQPRAQEFKELFWIIKGKKNIQERLGLQNKKVKREILACNRLSNILHTNIRTMKEAVDRGVTVKIICRHDPSKREVYQAWLKTGAKIRIFNEERFGPLLPRITIFDSETARLTIGKPEVERDEDYLTLWTESKAFSQMLKGQFMNMWRNSKPIERYLGRESKLYK